MRLATALVLLGAGLVSLQHPDTSPVVVASPEKHRTIAPRASRSMRRSPLRPAPHVRAKATVSDHRAAHLPARPPSSGDLGTQRGAVTLNWAALAQCEASGNPQAVSMGRYFGLYQFDLQTWASVGGTGNPVDASPAEQTARAQQLYNERGAAPWPVCGWRLAS